MQPLNAIEREILERFRALSGERQRQVRDFVARLAISDQPYRDIREPALDEWLSPEEDAAWAHLQDDRTRPEAGSPPIPAGGFSGEEMLRLGGTISPEDLDVMERVIEEDCERIDLEGW